MTEDEAKEKWCPHAIDCGYHEEYSGSFNRPVGLSTKCLGSECMAWRWESKSPYLKEKKDATTQGYCGLAGKP